jgi:hypothetical protein
MNGVSFATSNSKMLFVVHSSALILSYSHSVTTNMSMLQTVSKIKYRLIRNKFTETIIRAVIYNITYYHHKTGWLH